MPILNHMAQGKTPAGDIQPAPEFLIRTGPVIPVTIHLPISAQKAYLDSGDAVPAPISGMALVDTGATITCIDVKAAEKAKLPRTGVSKISSASHADQEFPTFAAQIVWPTINLNFENAIGANLSSLGGDFMDAGNELIALLGRDFLSTAILVYNGPAGHFSLAT